jgi:hypothetical protein
MRVLCWGFYTARSDEGVVLGVLYSVLPTFQ